MTLQLPGQRETINGLAGSIIEIIRYGLPEDYWDTYSAKVRALTVRDLAMAAERLVHPERLVWVIVGDRSKIEQGVRELNLGDLKVIDSDGNPAD